MVIKLYNTLTKNKEELKQVPNKEVGIYSCGPTVYNYPHIGNLRSFVFTDTLNRSLRYLGYKVKHLINITDVGHLTSDADSGNDKVEEQASKENKSAKDITEYYTNFFFDNLEDLNIDKSNYYFPKATDHIAEQIELVKKLEDKGVTYQIDDGIYFDTQKFPEYGKLGNIKTQDQQSQNRIKENTQKKSSSDFALWKFSENPGQRQQEWDPKDFGADWPIGFPGWHAECSAMSHKYLGDEFDIHTGGIDHVSVHHNNEIAQSKTAYGKDQAKIWMHHAFLNVAGDKMAKSSGDFLTLETLKKEGVHPSSLRLMFLNAHYKSQIEFNEQSIKNAQNSLNNILEDIIRLDITSKSWKSEHDNAWQEEIKNEISEIISDDLHTPQLLALLQKVLNFESKIDHNQILEMVFEIDKILGLDLAKLAEKMREVPKEIQELKEKRGDLRKENKMDEADKIRNQIQESGYSIKDYSFGTFVSLKSVEKLI